MQVYGSKNCAICKTLQASEIAAPIWEANWFNFLLSSKLIASKLDVFPKIWLESDVGREVSTTPSRWDAIRTNSSEYSQARDSRNHTDGSVTWDAETVTSVWEMLLKRSSIKKTKVNSKCWHSILPEVCKAVKFNRLPTGDSLGEKPLGKWEHTSSFY